VTRLALAAVVIVALAFATGSASAPTWSTVTQLSSGDRALGPELAISPAGDAAVVWDQEVGPDCASSPASLQCVHIVELTTRRRGTSSWLTPLELGRPGIGDRPHVAINDAGDAVVAWVHDIGRDRVLQATFRSRSATSWPEPNDISEPSLGIQDFQIGMDYFGNAIALWAERTETGVALRIATRSVVSGAWGAARTISRPGGNVSGGPSIALTPLGAIAVAWIEDGAVREIGSLIGSGSTSGDWASPLQLSASEGAAFGTPDIAFDHTRDDIAVVWGFRASSGSLGVRAAFHSFAQQAWIEQSIGDLLPPFDRPRVGAGNGTAVAVWVNGFGIVSATHVQQKGLSSLTAWSSETPVSARSSTAAEPDIALDSSGNAVAVWTSGPNGVVQSAIRPAASGSWRPPVDVSTAGSSKPLISSDVTLTVWNRSSPPRIAVETSDLTGGGPVLQNLRIPKKGTVRASLVFSVAPAPWSAPLAGEPVWHFGDGRSARGRRVVHRYKHPGSFRVSVTSRDAQGDTATASQRVRVVRRGTSQSSSGS